MKKYAMQTGRVVLALSISGAILAACGSQSSSSKVQSSSRVSSASQSNSRSVLLTAYHLAQKQKSLSLTGYVQAQANGESTTATLSGYSYLQNPNTKPSGVLVERTSVPGVATPEVLRYRIIDGTMYQQIPANERGFTTLGNASWVQYPAVASSSSSITSSTTAQTANPTAMLQLLLGKGVAGVQSVGTAMIGGHETTEYQGSVNIEKELAGLSAHSSDKALLRNLAALNVDGPAIAKIWIGSHGHVRQVSFSVDLSITTQGTPPNVAFTLVLHLDFGHYGASFAPVSAPSTGVISLSTYMSDLKSERPIASS
jgi:hypothetical protein